MPEMQVDPSQIMSLDEIRTVLVDGERRGRRSPGTRQNLVVFRLATCCGLRASEIAGLELRDLRVDSDAPYISVRKAVAKRRKARKVPLAWDQGTLAALRAWKAHRLAEVAAWQAAAQAAWSALPAHAAARELAAANPALPWLQPSTAPVVCTRQATPTAGGLAGRGLLRTPRGPSQGGRPLTRQLVARKFKAALKPLPPERRAELHTHSGRHTYASYMVRERGLAAARDALGHASVATTDVYLHVEPDVFSRPGSVFTFDAARDAGGPPAAPEASAP